MGDAMAEDEIGAVKAAIRVARSLHDLDDIRLRVSKAMLSGGEDVFNDVQQAFRKAKNKLKRVPLVQRA